MCTIDSDSVFPTCFVFVCLFVCCFDFLHFGIARNNTCPRGIAPTDGSMRLLDLCTTPLLVILIQIRLWHHCLGTADGGVVA